MISDLKYIQQIEDYLDGEMSGEELIQFEKELQSNTNLQKEVIVHKKIRKEFISKGKLELRKELERFYYEMENEKPKSKIIKLALPVISIAAGILLILYIYLGRPAINNPHESIISLDSTGVKKSPGYADSANYELIEELDTNNK